MRGVNWKATIAVALLTGSASAIDLNVNDETSIKNAASVAAKNTISLYDQRDSKNIPGKLDRSWFEGGVMFDALIRYWYYTGDSSHNDAVSDGMYWQRGDDDFFPSNYSQTLGNDDQVMWALAAMTAAEVGYPQRSAMSSWITLAENVFSEQIGRWDEDNCNGGMRWQIWAYESGYATKNAITNGGLFELAARLAHFSNNQTYSDWAEKIWDWSATSPLLNNATWTIYDSTSCEDDCATKSSLQWSFNYGVYMTGAAYMYNLTDGNSKWKSGLDGLLNSTSIFFPTHGYLTDDGTIMVEVACESVKTCTASMKILKGSFIQSLAEITVVAPYTSSKILPLLQGSATAAAKTCTGGTSKNLCGARWYEQVFDDGGIENQVAALSLFTSNLVAFNSHSPATQSTASNSTTGTSGGNGTTTSSGAAAATKTGSNAANVLTGSSVGVTTAVFAALLALF
ncbi:endo mannanase, GH76 family [Penicillium brasilianum]|uniref:Mannan endo-1,6-alpha-mannosidase n=1 Tax=Penicillium brasilianum TaxID=104259 RepID=A0A1S9S0D9_PENBI|nr:endo mannanase, GH76 family [Penicillium brasilianum]